MKIGLSSTPGSHSMGSAFVVTLRSPASDCFYFGISIPFRILRAEILARDGRFPLLDHAFPMAKMEGVLQRAIAVPPDCAPYVEPVVTPSIM